MTIILNSTDKANQVADGSIDTRFENSEFSLAGARVAAFFPKP